MPRFLSRCEDPAKRLFRVDSEIDMAARQSRGAREAVVCRRALKVVVVSRDYAHLGEEYAKCRFFAQMVIDRRANNMVLFV